MLSLKKPHQKQVPGKNPVLILPLVLYVFL